MTYYKVTAEGDNKRIKRDYFLVKGELYTAKELEKYNVPTKFVVPVEIKKNRTAFVFGARMAL